LESWAAKEDKYLKLYDLYAQSGGWEGWLQAELALELETFTNYTDNTVAPLTERELHIYITNPDDRTDIVFHLYTEASTLARGAIQMYHETWMKFEEVPRPLPIYTTEENQVIIPALAKHWEAVQSLSRTSFIIELKCESWKSRDKFKSNVEGDLRKIQQPIGLKRGPRHENPIVLVMAISISDERRRAMLQVRALPNLKSKVAMLGQDHRFNAILWIFGWDTDWDSAANTKITMWNGAISIWP
jgi:hypothetical protein